MLVVGDPPVCSALLLLLGIDVWVCVVTMASFYIPMALSLSANLAHLPPIHGLYSFAIQPLVG